MKIVLHPPFTDAAAFADRYWRAIHYLGPVADAIDEIEVRAALALPTEIPAYLDLSLRQREGAVRAKVRLLPASTAAGARDLVIVWDRAQAADAPAAPERYVLDPGMLHEGDLWIELGAHLRPTTASERAAAHATLIASMGNARAEAVNLFGSGPSLAALDHDTIPPGTNIVCNSLVANEALLQRLKPKFIVAVDPIFHAGASRHAGAFRERLIAALRAHDAHFIAQERDAHIYRATLPADLHPRLIPVPVRFGLRPNLDLTRRFHFTATRNVFTLALLSLSASLGRDVRCYGFDGRTENERTAFWSYDPASVLENDQQQQREAHPGFFDLDYEDYYALHCATVAAWLNAVEARGVRVSAETPTHIPALAARRGESVAALPIPSSAFQRRASRAFFHRQLQVLYGAALTSAAVPAGAKRSLRALVSFTKARNRRSSGGASA